MLWEGIRMDQRESAQVAYVPKILRNMAEICEEMGVGKDTVRSWVKDGAPICVEGNSKKNRYSAESLELQMWRRLNFRK